MTGPDTSSDFFEGMFRHSQDPWNFAADAYEQYRYTTIMQALQPGPYRHAFEPGCSVGALTEKLATICERVDACDFSPTAVKQAQERCHLFSGVTVRCAAVTDRLPSRDCDLIVLSEIGYYFSSIAWQCLISDIVRDMQPRATLLASHWLGSSPDHVLSGDEVHELMQHPQMQLEHSERHPHPERGGFRLDCWSKL